MIQLGAILIASLQTLASTPPAALDEALRFYWNGEYEQTVSTLDGSCTNELTVGQRLECHQYLAFSLVALGDEEAAEREFMKMLTADPAYRLDPELFSPKILKRFDASRERLAEEIYSQSKQAYFNEDFETAITLIEKTLLIEPENELALEYRTLAKERIAMSANAASPPAAAARDADEDSDSPVAETRQTAAPQVPVPEPDASGVYRHSSEIQRPVLIERTQPRYPLADRQRGVSGSVVLSVVIGSDGRVREPTVIRSVSPSMDRAATDAVQNWRYQPAVLNGTPVPVYGVVRMNFEYSNR